MIEHSNAITPDEIASLLTGRKINAIKMVRERTGMGLKEALELVNNVANAFSNVQFEIQRLQEKLTMYQDHPTLLALKRYLVTPEMGATVIAKFAGSNIALPELDKLLRFHVARAKLREAAAELGVNISTPDNY